MALNLYFLMLYAFDLLCNFSKKVLHLNLPRSLVSSQGRRRFIVANFDDIKILTREHDRALFAVGKLLMGLIRHERMSGYFIWMIAAVIRL